MRPEREQIMSRFTFGLVFALAMGLGPLAVPAQEEASRPDPGWPRELTDGSSVVTLYQPQIESWEDYQYLEFRMAVAIQLDDDEAPLIGAVRVRVHTITDLEERTVVVESVDSLFAHFPAIDENSSEAASRVDQIVRETIEASGPYSLDRIVAGMEAGQFSSRAYELRMAAPPVFYHEGPALLVIFDGKPQFNPVGEGAGLQFAVNTNWDLFRVEGSEDLYLLNEEDWLHADSESGPWNWTSDLPRGMRDLPDTENFAEARAAAAQPAVPSAPAPAVYTSDEPAELIQVEGPPTLEPVNDTSLLFVSNTNSDLIFDIDAQQWYLLASGRWFVSPDGKTGWTALETDLPADFSKISEDGSLAHILVAVPGTPQADLAVIEAEVPQQAKVAREGLEPDVEYTGDPEFEAIEETGVDRAVNTSSDVLRAEGEYYCVQDGVWFSSSSASGPWIVCDTVPQVIYTIPPASPSFHVTFVHSYWHSSTHVVFGYTSGYMGVYVSGGCVRFGTGWHYPPYFWYPSPFYRYRYPIYYPRRHYSYGCSAWYNPRAGGYVRGGRVYGPYGGVGRASYYNPRTGTYARGGGAWGPRGGTWGATAYNPRTGARVSTRQSVSPYGQWGSSVVSRNGNWVQTGHASGVGGSAKGWRTSEGGKGAVVTDRHGNTSGIAKGRNDDLYVGRDGEVYRRNEDGWQKHDGDGWSPVDDGGRERPDSREARPENRDARPETREARPETREARPESREARPESRESRPDSREARPAQPSQNRSQSDRSRDLDRQQQNRDRSNQYQQRSQQQRSSPQPRSQPQRPQNNRSGGSRGGGGRRG